MKNRNAATITLLSGAIIEVAPDAQFFHAWEETVGGVAVYSMLGDRVLYSWSTVGQIRSKEYEER